MLSPALTFPLISQPAGGASLDRGFGTNPDYQRAAGAAQKNAPAVPSVSTDFDSSRASTENQSVLRGVPFVRAFGRSGSFWVCECVSSRRARRGTTGSIGEQGGGPDSPRNSGLKGKVEGWTTWVGFVKSKSVADFGEPPRILMTKVAERKT